MLLSCSARDTSSSDEDADRPSGRSVARIPRDWRGFELRDGLRSPRWSTQTLRLTRGFFSPLQAGLWVSRYATRGESRCTGTEEVQVATSVLRYERHGRGSNRGRKTIGGLPHYGKRPALFETESRFGVMSVEQRAAEPSDRRPSGRLSEMADESWLRLTVIDHRDTSLLVSRNGPVTSHSFGSDSSDPRLRSRGDAGRTWFGNNRKATTAAMQHGYL